MKIGSLFAGIGGFDLAAEWMGWRTIWFSEIDKYACRVLAERFPGVPNLGDITRIDWRAVESPDVLCGGFPCQPHSLAGKRAGSDDRRDLWPEYARAIRELRPRYVVAENVPGLLTSDRGGMFNRVLSDLAAIGYDAEWEVLSAADVGAPHRRERVWIVAYPDSELLNGSGIAGAHWRSESSDRRTMAHAESGEQSQQSRGDYGWSSEASGEVRPVAGTSRRGEGGSTAPRSDDARGTADAMAADVPHTDSRGRWPGVARGDNANRSDTGRTEANRLSGTLSEDVSDALCSDGEGVEQTGDDAQVGRITGERPARLQRGAREHHGWETEPNVGRLAHGIPDRVGKLRALGNAIVPQCAVEGPFRRILELEAERRQGEAA